MELERSEVMSTLEIMRSDLALYLFRSKQREAVSYLGTGLLVMRRKVRLDRGAITREGRWQLCLAWLWTCAVL